MKRFVNLGLIALLALPATTLATTPEEAALQQLQQQIEKLSAELEALSKKVEASKGTGEQPTAAAQPTPDEFKELEKRLDKVERHATLDRIEFSGDLRGRVHSLHYQDVTFNPGVQVDFDRFGADAMSGAFGSPADPNSPLAQMMAANPGLASMFANGQLQGIGPFPFLAMPKTYNINNDILYNSRLRLNMKAKVWDNVKFSGRLNMYKNWGDSTGVKVFDSWNSFTMDGTSSSSTSGDGLHVDRAYFDWSNIGGSGVYLSIGRRPSTYGPPTEFRENEMRGGTPTGNVMNLNFDGITIGRSLEDWTGIEGMVARFCYGQGFESEWGNGELFNNLEKLKDTHFAGFNFDLYNDGSNFLQATIFTAQDINDGFKGLIAFPTEYGAFFAPTLYNDMQKFPNFNFVTRVQPSTTIGDMNLAGLVFSREEENGLKWFTSAGWTQLRPNGKAGMFGGMGSDAIFQAQLNSTGTEIMMVPVSADDDKNRNGYGVYVGMQVPAPMGKFGLEYNYGSKYWTPFTQGQDDPVDSKLATRGHVGEAYYIVEINPRMFLKMSGIYYDYEYSGSGSPVGKPKKIDDIEKGNAYSMLPVIDTAYDLNASLTVQF
ncbi:MAG: DUF3373 family protein [Desulfuromonadales bacterium]|nr:DUF3373 family protein [Desulfuromonadales bacterium]